MTRWLVVLTITVGISSPVWARSHATTRQFQHLYPCPSTGRVSGSCPGYVKDHIIPLCAGGPDRPDNMQWQTVAEGHAKDRLERQMCR